MENASEIHVVLCLYVRAYALAIHTNTQPATATSRGVLTVHLPVRTEMGQLFQQCNPAKHIFNKID